MGVGSNGMGPAVATWESLGEWSRTFLRIELEYWEAMLIVRLSYARAVVEGEKTQRDMKSKSAK